MATAVAGDEQVVERLRGADLPCELHVGLGHPAARTGRVGCEAGPQHDRRRIRVARGDAERERVGEVDRRQRGRGASVGGGRGRGRALRSWSWSCVGPVGGRRHRGGRARRAPVRGRRARRRQQRQPAGDHAAAGDRSHAPESGPSAGPRRIVRPERLDAGDASVHAGSRVLDAGVRVGAGGAGEQGLEVGALGEADGMVDRLARLAEDAQVPAGAAGGAADRGDELVGGHPAAARRLDEQTVRGDQPQGLVGQLGVRAERSGHVGLALGERGWIDDDDVELAVLAAEAVHHLERVALLDRVAARGDRGQAAVVVHVALGGRQRAGAGVHAQHRCGAAGCGVDAEPAGAGEHVEHRRAGGQRADQGAVVALVEERPRLLPVDHVGLELQSELAVQDRCAGGLAVQGHAVVEAVHRRRALQRPGQAQHHGARPQRRHDDRQDRGQVGDPRRAVQLEHEGVGVAVEHEPGEAVVLPVDAAVPGGVRGRQRRPSFQRGVQATLPERCIDRRRRTTVEDLQADRRARVVQPDRDELALVVEHHGQVTGRAAGAERTDRLGVDPRMSGDDLAAGVGGEAHGEALVRRGRQVRRQRHAARG